MVENTFSGATIVIPTYISPPVFKENISFYEEIAKQHNREVIIVDDGNHPALKLNHDSLIKVIRNDKNQGVSQARNKGLNNAKFNTVIFIDDDVTFKKEILEKAITRFQRSKAKAFSCMHSSFYSKDNFPTRYKSKYMNATFKKVTLPIQFIYGSLCGLKKETKVNWPKDVHFGEDTYLATILINQGKQIDFYDDLEFNHHKAYNFKTLLKNDFLIPFHFVKSFFFKKRKKESLFSYKFKSTQSDRLSSPFPPYISSVVIF